MSLLEPKKVVPGQIYTDLKTKRKLRRLMVDTVSGGWATCIVAYGPNGKFEKLHQVVKISVTNLQKRALYRLAEQERCAS